MLRGWIVELGPVEEVLGSPRHPYTQLLNSFGAGAGPISALRDWARDSRRYGLLFRSSVWLPLRGPLWDVSVDGVQVKCHLYTDSEAPKASPPSLAAT